MHTQLRVFRARSWPHPASHPGSSFAACAMNKIIPPSTSFTCRNCVLARAAYISGRFVGKDIVGRAIKRGDAAPSPRKSQRTVRRRPNIWMKLSRAVLASAETRCLRCSVRVSTVSCFFVFFPGARCSFKITRKRELSSHWCPDRQVNSVATLLVDLWRLRVFRRRPEVDKERELCSERTTCRAKRDVRI